MNRRVIFFSIVVALGGFLFGFDTAVISGAEQAIQKYWNLDEYQHGLTVSIALIGTVFGALFGGIPCDRFGRKNTLFVVAVLYLLSALGSAVAESWVAFLIYRFVGGVGVGASSVAAPMYISEISPAESRGKLVALFQANIVIGILVAYISNYALSGQTGENDWRWMLGVEAFPAFFFSVLIRFVSESPRWLVAKKGLFEQAEKILQLNGIEDPKEKVEQMIQLSHQDQEKKSVFSASYRFPVILAFSLAFFNQVTGINAVIYYAPRIFEMTGLGKSGALLSSMGIGIVNLVATIIAFQFIDRFGRRTLMKYGSFGLIATLGLISYSFLTNSFHGMSVPIYIFAFIASFAFSQGAVVWVYISEIFPNEVRASGQALGSFTHWIMAALISFSFPVFSKLLGAGNTFLIFAVMMVLQLIFVLKVMPETKGRTLEEISSSLTK